MNSLCFLSRCSWSTWWSTEILQYFYFVSSNCFCPWIRVCISNPPSHRLIENLFTCRESERVQRVHGVRPWYKERSRSWSRESLRSAPRSPCQALIVTISSAVLLSVCIVSNEAQYWHVCFILRVSYLIHKWSFFVTTQCTVCKSMTQYGCITFLSIVFLRMSHLGIFTWISGISG
mgnify:CR=1 FL=1